MTHAEIATQLAFNLLIFVSVVGGVPLGIFSIFALQERWFWRRYNAGMARWKDVELPDRWALTSRNACCHADVMPELRNLDELFDQFNFLKRRLGRLPWDKGFRSWAAIVDADVADRTRRLEATLAEMKAIAGQIEAKITATEAASGLCIAA